LINGKIYKKYNGWKKLRIAICGVSGFIGTNVSRFLVDSGYEVIRLGREHLENCEKLVCSLDGCSVVINLCGAPIAKRWSEKYKEELYLSRIETTKKLIDAVELLENKPSTFITVSSVGIYKEDMTHDESSVEFGTNYLSLLVKDWEREGSRAKEMNLRTVILRLGLVLGSGGGACDEIKRIFKMGLGGVVASGSQPLPWVHLDDVVAVFKRAIENDTMSEVYNVVAPEIVSMKTFMKMFGKTINRPAWLNIPETMVKLKYGEGSESLLKGSFVVPKRLEDEGYEFKYQNLNIALQSILCKV
jgi:uncharacterized protein (TIGR01777 family)